MSDESKRPDRPAEEWRFDKIAIPSESGYAISEVANIPVLGTFEQERHAAICVAAQRLLCMVSKATQISLDELTAMILEGEALNGIDLSGLIGDHEQGWAQP